MNAPVNASYLRTITSQRVRSPHQSVAVLGWCSYIEESRDSNQLHRFSGVPGSGHVPWGVFDALLDAGYDGWLTIERFGSACRLTRSKQRVAA